MAICFEANCLTNIFRWHWQDMRVFFFILSFRVGIVEYLTKFAVDLIIFNQEDNKFLKRYLVKNHLKLIRFTLCIYSLQYNAKVNIFFSVNGKKLFETDVSHKLEYFLLSFALCVLFPSIFILIMSKLCMITACHCPRIIVIVPICIQTNY